MATNKDVKTALAKRNGGGNGNGNPPTIGGLKALLASESVKKRFDEVLGKRAPQFISSIINLANSDATLSKCEPMSIISAAMIAATMDLPIDKNLGYAWLVPYQDKKTQTYKAQFQLGWKGYVQLALRTAQYRSINVIPLYEGQLKKWNPLTEEIEIDFETRVSDAITHYCGYFELLNGFKKTVVWTREQIIEHAKKYSKSFHNENSPWKDPEKFEGMALKTVVRNMLSKWGILSIEMQEAYSRDVEAEEQPEAADEEYIDVDYTVNDEPEQEEEAVQVVDGQASDESEQPTLV